MCTQLNEKEKRSIPYMASGLADYGLWIVFEVGSLTPVKWHGTSGLWIMKKNRVNSAPNCINKKGIEA